MCTAEGGVLVFLCRDRRKEWWLMCGSVLGMSVWQTHGRQVSTSRLGSITTCGNRNAYERLNLSHYHCHPLQTNSRRRFATTWQTASMVKASKVDCRCTTQAPWIEI